jgi:rhodanese-related sulfurtransferase
MMYEQLSIQDYKTTFVDEDQDHLLLDVRTDEEFAEVRIPGAVNIPLDTLDDHIDDIRAMAGEKPLVMVCRTGIRSMMAAQMLRMSGLSDPQIFNLAQGTQGWKNQGWPVETGT